jgi:hypothetical protein
VCVCVRACVRLIEQGMHVCMRVQETCMELCACMHVRVRVHVCACACVRERHRGHLCVLV